MQRNPNERSNMQAALISAQNIFFVKVPQKLFCVFRHFLCKAEVLVNLVTFGGSEKEDCERDVEQVEDQ